MNKGFFLKLSGEEQQFVNKIILFVNANTKLKVDIQENFIKFGFSLDDPSVFYISKNSDGKVFIKFKVIENVSEKPNEKEYLPQSIDKVLMYIKAAHGYKKSLISFLEDAIKFEGKNSSKSTNSAKIYSYNSKNVLTKPKNNNSEDKQKLEDWVEFLKEIFNLHIIKEKNIDFLYIKPYKAPLVSIQIVTGKFSGNSAVIKLLDPMLQLGDKQNYFEIDSNSEINLIEEKVFEYLEQMNKLINPNIENSNELPKESKNEITIEINEEENNKINEEFTLIDQKIDKFASRPRKIFISSKFKKSVDKLPVSDKEKVFAILQDIESAPMGAQFLKNIK
jgi:hypothetical protein